MSILRILDAIKTYKSIKKGSPGMNFQNFTKRIISVNETENFENPKKEYRQKQRFSAVDGKMQKTSIMKTKSSQTNDERFYLSNGIISLPIVHPYLSKLTQYKEEKGEKVEKHFLEEKNYLLRMEKEAFLSNERLSLYQQILSQDFTCYYWIKVLTKNMLIVKI